MKKHCHDLSQNFVLCISGMTGCGKSTVSKKIANKYKKRYLSGGDALKKLAMEKGYKRVDRGWWESEEGTRFLEKRKQDHSFDKKVDKKLLEWGKRGNVVLDSWTMPWLLKPGLKVWLEASPETRAKRISQRDGINIKKAFAALKKKDEETKAIYKELYGINLGEDFSPFDIVIDVNNLNSEEVFGILILVIDQWLSKQVEEQ